MKWRDECRSQDGVLKEMQTLRLLLDLKKNVSNRCLMKRVTIEGLTQFNPLGNSISAKYDREIPLSREGSN